MRLGLEIVRYSQFHVFSPFFFFLLGFGASFLCVDGKKQRGSSENGTFSFMSFGNTLMSKLINALPVLKAFLINGDQHV